MAKIKTHRVSAKRFRCTGIGKLRRYKAYKSHIIGKKSPKRIRDFCKGSLMSKSDRRRIDHVIP